MADGYVSGCRVCGKPTKRFASSGRFAIWCSRTCRKKVSRTCVQCGRNWHAERRAASGLCKPCSCAKASRVKSELDALRRIANSRRLLAVNVRSNGTVYRRYWRPSKIRQARHRQVIRRFCECCGREFERRVTQQGRFCSKACLGKFSLSRDRVQKKPHARRCLVCEVKFTPLPAYYKDGCCSCECRELRQKEARNAVKRKRRVSERDKAYAVDPVAYYVNALDVFKRDGWRCQACGCETPKALRGTCGDNAPELDHIVPVAHGGDHAVHNLQCLCRTCNALKSSMSMEDFMLWATGGDVKHLWDQ